MTKFLDANNCEICNGHVIDLHQTVNGQHLFIVADIDNLDVRYYNDITRKYEYSVPELFVKEVSFQETETSIVRMLSRIEWFKLITQLEREKIETQSATVQTVKSETTKIPTAILRGYNIYELIRITGKSLELCTEIYDSTNSFEEQLDKLLNAED